MKIVHNLSGGYKTTLGKIIPGTVFSLSGIPNSILIKVGSDNGHTAPVLKFDYTGLKWNSDRFSIDEEVIAHEMTFEP